MHTAGGDAGGPRKREGKARFVLKLQKKNSLGVPKRALRDLLCSRRKLEAFEASPADHAFSDRWAWTFDRRGPSPAVALHEPITHDAGIPDGA